MEHKETYTPAEIARMVETHLGVESSLIKLQNEMTEARDSIYSAGKKEQVQWLYGSYSKGPY